MAQEVFINPRPVVDSDDVVAQVNVLANAVGTKLVYNKNNSAQLYTRTGRAGRLVFIGNAVDSGGETSITFHLKINGARGPAPYDSFTQALGLTYDPQGRMSVPLRLPQGALIEFEADNSSSTAYNAFIRMRIEYEDLN